MNLSAIASLLEKILKRIHNLEKQLLAKTQPKKSDLYTWLDGQDVMQLLRISPRELQTLRDEKILPYSKPRGKIYYKSTDVEAYLQKHYTGSKELAEQEEY